MNPGSRPVQPDVRRQLPDVQRLLRGLQDLQQAAAVGLHGTTARVHLEVLERAGLVRHAVQRAGRPGRPRQLYAAVPRSAPVEGYRQLVGVLAAELAAGPDAGRRAEQAGWSWAAQQVPAGAAGSWTRRPGASGSCSTGSGSP